jgi:AraC family transcriptional regulator
MISRFSAVTHGTGLRARTMDGFSLTEAVYAPHCTLPAHDHRFPSWTYVAAGSFDEAFSTGTEHCSAGSVLSKPSDARHSNRYGTAGATCLLIELADITMISEDRAAPLFRRTMQFDRGAVSRIAWSLMREFRKWDAGSTIAVQSLLLDLALAMFAMLIRPRRRSRGDTGWLSRARERLVAEFRTPPSINALAADAGVHAVYLCQAFRQAFGLSPGEFVRWQRIEWARQALRTTGTPLVTIALAAGFSDQSHFTRQFRAHTGVTPAQFRAAGHA